MKTITNKQFDETYYSEVLANGLEVIIYHKPEFRTTACVLGTPFGALDLVQTFNGETKQFHSGLAHFLEHKLFESDDRDIMLQFNALGANVNAFTSYDCTVYYFTIANQMVEKPLNLLLDFVQSLSITENSVEKEKGIITQELMMYQQMPEFRLLFETYKSLYHTLPLKYDIGGSPDDVMAISKSELEQCYQLNYHPSKMKMIIVSPIEPVVLFEIVKANQNNKTFSSRPQVDSVYKETNKQVVVEKNIISMDVVNPKVALAFKFNSENVSKKQVIKQEWCLQLLMEMTFTAVNPAYQQWLDQGYINNFFGVEVEFGKGYRHLLFYNETSDEEAFKAFILKQLQSIKENGINETLLIQIQRRFYGLSFKVYDDVENIAVNHLRYLFDELDYLEVVKMILDIQSEDLLTCLNSLDFENYSLIKIDKLA